MQLLQLMAAPFFLSSFNTFVRDKTEEFRGVDKSSIFNILNSRFPGALEGF